MPDTIYVRENLGTTISSTQFAHSYCDGRIASDETFRLGARRLTREDVIRLDEGVQEILASLPQNSEVERSATGPITHRRDGHTTLGAAMLVVLVVVGWFSLRPLAQLLWRQRANDLALKELEEALARKLAEVEEAKVAAEAEGALARRKAAAAEADIACARQQEAEAEAAKKAAETDRAWARQQVADAKAAKKAAEADRAWAWQQLTEEEAEKKAAEADRVWARQQLAEAETAKKAAEEAAKGEMALREAAEVASQQARQAAAEARAAQGAAEAEVARMEAEVVLAKRVADAALAKQMAAEAHADQMQRLAEEATRKLAADVWNRRVNSLSLPGEVKLELRWVRAGSFIMGGGRDEDESPHRVTLTQDFWLGTYEVTQAQWQAVLGEQPSGFRGASLPVENVSWDDAQRFCARLNKLFAGKLPPGYAFCLPTEAQWEYVCRAGAEGDYHGEVLEQVGWYVENGGSQTHPVGQKRPNAWGFHDMHGNVMEWCQDWYGKYYYRLSEVVQDPSGPQVGEFRVTRGGAWCSLPSWCTSSCRNYSNSFYRSKFHGFRICLAPCR